MVLDNSVLLVAQGGGVMAPEILTGVYKAFQESGVIPGQMLASSGGALFGGLYYSGHDSSWFKELMETQDLSQWMEIAPLQAVKSLYSKSNYIIDNAGLQTFLYDNMTADAMTRVRVSVTRLDDYSSELKDATPTWVLAATSIPFLFRPVQTKTGLYGDGGVMNNIPVPSIEDMKQYRKVYIVLTPPTKFYGKLKGFSGLIDLLNAVMNREITQMKEAGYLDLPNVQLIQPAEDYNSNILKWSEDFKMRDEAYAITKQMLNEKGA